MIDLPPLEDDELPAISKPSKYKVPFKLKESMLCYGCNEDSYGRRDLVGWLEIVECDYNKTHSHHMSSNVYMLLRDALSDTFPALDFDAVSRYCDDERLCPRPKLIEAWRAFISNMDWDECDEPELNHSRRQQTRKK